MMQDGKYDGADGSHGATWTPPVDGEAAMMLAESMLHQLIARGLFSVGEAIDVVGVAVEARTAMSVERGDDPAATRRAVGGLAAIAASLRLDVAPGHSVGDGLSVVGRRADGEGLEGAGSRADGDGRSRADGADGHDGSTYRG